MLTPVETDILKQLSEGELMKNIAQDRGTSERTVRWHVENIKRKLEVHTLAGAVGRAIRAAIIGLSLALFPIAVSQTTMQLQEPIQIHKMPDGACIDDPNEVYPEHMRCIDGTEER